jgi:hypothetical protein
MGMKPRERRWRWVTRDYNNTTVDIWSGPGKPWHYGDQIYWNAECSRVCVCPNEFKKLFGFLPPIEEAIRVEFTAKQAD